MNNIANQISNIVFLTFLAGIPLYGVLKKINVFDAFVGGAKQGFETCVSIIPYLIAMMVAIGMLRASGFFELMSNLLAPVFNTIGFPSELLPLSLMRPFSGSASLGLMAELIHKMAATHLLVKRQLQSWAVLKQPFTWLRFISGPWVFAEQDTQFPQDYWRI